MAKNGQPDKKKPMVTCKPCEESGGWMRKAILKEGGDISRGKKIRDFTPKGLIFLNKYHSVKNTHN